MRKITLTAAVLAIGLTASAQQKGDVYVSGSLSVSGGSTTESVKVNNTTNSLTSPAATTFTISPKFGYFITDNLDVNVSLNYALSKEQNNTVTSNKDKKLYDFEHIFTINPGVRYYLALGSDKFFYTPGAELAFGFSKSVSQFTADTKLTPKEPFIFGFSLDLAAFEFRPTEHFGLTLSAGSLDYVLAHLSDKENIGGVEAKTTANINTASLGLNLGAKIGFKYYF